MGDNLETEVRKATKDDAAQIAEIIAEISSDPDPVGFPETLSTEQVAAWIERQGDNGAMFVVDDGRQVLGFAALAEEALAFARDRGYKRIRARLPEKNEPALSYLSSIGAMVPMRNPGTTFELPIYQENE
jgi:GNAT superfamily N-acetyltransferase